MDVHGITESSPSVNDFNILWTGVHPKPFVLRNLYDYQRVNHFPRSVLLRFDHLLNSSLSFRNTLSAGKLAIFTDGCRPLRPSVFVSVTPLLACKPILQVSCRPHAPSNQPVISRCSTPPGACRPSPALPDVPRPGSPPPQCRRRPSRPVRCPGRCRRSSSVSTIGVRYYVSPGLPWCPEITAIACARCGNRGDIGLLSVINCNRYRSAQC